MEDRDVTENRLHTDSIRHEEAFAGLMSNSVLPNLPDDPNWHYMWATTTNSRAPVQRYLQSGYQVVRAEDVPGFEYLSQKTGEYAGAIGVNEMIALRCPKDRYRAIMKHFHHDLPKAEQERRDSMLDAVKEQAAERGLRVTEGDQLLEGDPDF